RIVQRAAGAAREEAYADVAAGGPTPEEAAASREAHRAIRDEIRSLSPKLRDTLLLAQSGAYDYAEIAGMLGVPLGTIKWRISEARRIVKARLRARGHGDVVSDR